MKQPTVFISYSRKDGEFVHRLADDLRARGYEVWIDISGLRGGEVWVREIEEAVEGCDVFVLILSPDSVESDWVRNETIYAQSLKKPLIPIMWRDVHLPIYLINVQYVDFRGRYEDALQRLYEALPQPDGELTPPPAPPEATLLGEVRAQLRDLPSLIQLVGISLILLGSLFVAWRLDIIGGFLSAPTTTGPPAPTMTVPPTATSRVTATTAPPVVGGTNLRGRIRPVQPGTSASSLAGGTGTICCIVKDAEGQQYLLSSDHVFQGDVGTAVIQPGVLDGGQSSDQVAEVADKIELQPDRANRVAGAMARLAPGVEASSEIPGVGQIRGVATAVQPGETVRVVGRTSGLVEGEVRGTDASIQIQLGELGSVPFEGLIAITKSSAAGDSGAPVLTRDNKLVGMVYASSQTVTLVMPIGPILRAFDVELILYTELEAGTVRVIGGTEMVYVPAGTFEMGSESGDDDEEPVHTVSLDAFWIDRYEVTNDQYVRFLNAVGGHTDQCEGQRCIETKAEDEDSHIQLENGRYVVESSYEDHPVIEVTWHGAQAYCEWRGRNESEQVRLPTEAEWEKAARGTDGRIWPWGNEWDGSKLNFCDVNCEVDWKDESVDDGYARTAPIGSYEAGDSPYGAYDMAGNVWEWTSSLYEDYPYDPEDGREDLEVEGSRVLRGGAWGNGRDDARAADRSLNSPDLMSDHVGVRCAASPGSP